MRRRLLRRTILGLAIAVALAGKAGAQLARPVLRAAAPSDPQAATAAGMPGFRLQGLAPTAESSSNRRRSLLTSASVVGGAALGAWFGYFVSQVVKSDWEGERTAERAGHRRTFALSGAALGAVGGYLIRPRFRGGGAPQRAPTYMYVPRSPRQYIARAELRRAAVLTALEAVQALRPEWLTGGSSGGGVGTGPPSSAGVLDTAIAVYAVDARLGGPEVLAEISIPEIEELRLYEPAEAQRRWGAAHRHGAIEVVPATDRPPR